MSDRVTLLMFEFLSWIAARSRSYDETMDAWRSSCPRHTVWEDALADGLVQIDSEQRPNQATVTLTPLGRTILDDRACRKGTS